MIRHAAFSSVNTGLNLNPSLPKKSIVFFKSLTGRLMNIFVVSSVSALCFATLSYAWHSSISLLSAAEAESYLPCFLPYQEMKHTSRFRVSPSVLLVFFHQLLLLSLSDPLCLLPR